MRIIPVIDLKHGTVVHAVGGRRETYQPLRSRLVSGSDPHTIAACYRQQLGLEEVYVADLEALAGRTPSWQALSRVAAAGGQLWLDLGVQDAERARTVHRCTAGFPQPPILILALEALSSPAAMAEIVAALGSASLAFSLDLRDGMLQTRCAAWQDATAWQVAEDVVGLGIHRMIVLDVGSVGAQRGWPCFAICRQLRAEFAQLELISGGGVRGKDDLETLREAGCDAALVATALHEGRLF